MKSNVVKVTNGSNFCLPRLSLFSTRTLMILWASYFLQALNYTIKFLLVALCVRAKNSRIINKLLTCYNRLRTLQCQLEITNWFKYIYINKYFAWDIPVFSCSCLFITFVMTLVICAKIWSSHSLTNLLGKRVLLVPLLTF